MSMSDIYPIEFTDFDKIQYNNNFTNFNYVNNNTGNTVLHLISMVPHKFKDLQDIIVNILKKGKFLATLNNEKSNFLHIAAKYENYEFLKLTFKILNNLNVLMTKNNNEETPFTIICSKNNLDIAKLLIDNKINFDVADLINSTVEFQDQIVEYILNSTIKSISPKEPEFRIYSLDEFEHFIKPKNNSGSYGEVTIATNKADKSKYILKKFIRNVKKFYLPDEIIREIMILKALNRYGYSAKIHGIIFVNDDFYVVMEQLDSIISNRINIINILSSVEKRETHFMKMINDCLHCIDANSKAGFIHCDTKGDNLMIDIKGNVRYIDYGFSYFIGISPFQNNVDKIIHEGGYLSYDGVSNLETEVMYEVTNFEDFTVKKSINSYNIDIPSIALMIIYHSIDYAGSFDYNKRVLLWISHKGIIYNKVNRMEKTYFRCVRVHEKVYPKMISTFGQKVTDILIRMLDVDPKMRPTAKEFLGNFTYPILNPLKIEYTGNNNLNKIIKMYNRDYNGTEFVYYDDIYNHWKDKKILLIKIPSDINFAPNNIDEIIVNHKISLDTLYNSYYYIHKLINSGFQSNNYIIVFLCVMLTYTKLYDDSTFDKDSFEYQCESYGFNVVTNKAELNSIFKHIISDPEFYEMIPTMPIVNYIKFILSLVCSDSQYLSDLMERFNIELFNHIINYNGKFWIGTVSEMVKSIYDLLPNRIEFDL